MVRKARPTAARLADAGAGGYLRAMSPDLALGRSLARRVRTRRAEAQLSPVAKRVRREHLTYLRPERLQVLERCAAEVRRGGVAGDFVECGVALGGSLVLLASVMGPGRELHGYDVFGMIPPPSEHDPPEVHERYAVIVAGESDGIGGDRYYGYEEDLLGRVSATAARYGFPVGDRVHLHRGLFEDTLHPTGPVALAHIDSDWFEPVDCCLRRIGPLLEPGGLIVLDDYEDYGGCKEAADAFVAEQPGFSLRELPAGGNAAIVRG